MAAVTNAGRARATVGYGRRALGALLDLLLGYVGLVLAVAAWSWIERPAFTGASVALPAWITIATFAAAAVYLALSAWRGATLGMLVAGLRVVSATTGEAVSLPRAVARTVAVIVVVVLILWVNPILFPVYGLAMFLEPDHRLPHDLVTGTLVVRSHALHGPVVPLVTPASPDVEPRAATSLLRDLERLRRSVRSDLHTGSVPLLTLGLMALGGGVVAAATGPTMSSAFLLRPAYWAVVTPVGLFVAMLWFRAVRRRAGLGFDTRWLVALIVIAVAVALVGVVLPIGPALAGLAFLVLAVHEESPSAAAGALLLAVVVGIEELTRFFSFSLVSNRFPGTSAASFADDYGSAVLYALLGVALLGAGLLALRHEKAGELAP